MRCTAITMSGQRCRMFALRDEDKCVIHSQSEIAVKARQKSGKTFTKKDMIMELQRQLRNVKRSEADSLEKSREVRMILAQIDVLKKDDKPSGEKEDPKSEDTFEEKVKKCMKEKKKSQQ